ncbi:MAG: hypothetical protein MK101_03685 [Phycisphaerales bacterium]|nr:hypothetical protein [Phycisphaerales bacterium]
MDQQHQSEQHPVELPCPCAGPLIAAFGVTFMFAGIVTTWSVAIVGLSFALAGAVHWWREVLPDPREYEPVIDTHPDAIEARIGQVGRLMAQPTHRARIPLEIHPYSAGVVGGIIGGVAMAVVALIGSLASHGSLWYAVNVLAGTILPSIGDMDQTALSAFHGGALAVGLGIHIVMSLFIGLVYGVIMPLVPRWPLFWAAIIMPAIWCGLTLASLSVINPALEMHIEWGWFIGAQVAFGLACGAWIVKSEKISTMQNWSYLERLGMDSPGVPGMQAEDES